MDIEEMNSGVSIMDLGLNEFRLDLLEYMKTHKDIEHMPYGLHAVVGATENAKPGVIYVLKNKDNGVNIDKKNRLHPFYMVYISNDGEPIPAAVRQEIFVPFFTTKSSGSGIGLSLSRQILIRQGILLSLADTPVCGYHVSFVLKSS